jgi:hypothetical protein
LQPDDSALDRLKEHEARDHGHGDPDGEGDQRRRRIFGHLGPVDAEADDLPRDCDDE